MALAGNEDVIGALVGAYYLQEENERRRRNIVTRWLLGRSVRQQVSLRGPYNVMNRPNSIITRILQGDPRTTKLHIRILPESFRMIVETCGPRKTHGWSLELEVMTFLFWLACGTAFRIVSSVFGIPPSTVHEMTNRILSKIVASADHFIKIPPEAELGVIGAAFARAAQSAVFSVCVGAIGGVHIKTLCPGQLHDQHIDRKLKYSISMQAIVDHQGQFINIMAGFPGSYQDSRILRYSSVYRRSLYPPRGYFLVGDSGYPCMREPITIITPYKEPGLIPQKREFNTALSKARICVEQSFGMMKTRWSSIFIKDVEVRLRKGVQVLAACAIMHNICVLNNDLFAPELQQPVLPRQQPRDEADGIRHRDIMLALFRAERNV